MSTRREDDSRSAGSANSPRNTERAVPAAKFKEGSVGTLAPRGLRGLSLLPGQGAPERILPEEVELAVVLREAETLDGAQVARASAPHQSELRSPSPTPVSVEVPRARSGYPMLDESPSTPPASSARSIQSGTLLSIGSVDPRAPTELNLPSPRPLSVAERAAYLGPPAVVDRRPEQPPRELTGAVESSRFELSDRGFAPYSEPAPYSSSRTVPSSAGGVPSAPPSRRADSVAPDGQDFARAARSYSPVLPPSPSPTEASRRVPSASPAGPHLAPQFQIHANLDALLDAVQDDAFDLRSTSTQREPLASRKLFESTDGTARTPISGRPSRTPSPGELAGRRSSSPVSVALADSPNPAAPISQLSTAQRATVPLTWVLAAFAFALLLALIVAWVVRPPGAQGTPSAAVGRPSSSAVASAASRPTLPGDLPRASLREGAPRADVPAPTLGLPRPLNSSQKAAPLRSATSPAPVTLPAPDPSTSPDANPKAHQSIY
jgi:hypothetical protein